MRMTSKGKNDLKRTAPTPHTTHEVLPCEAIL